MIHTIRRDKYPRYSNSRSTIPDWMGYPGSDYSRYDPHQEDGSQAESRSARALEGAGRTGWDNDQNRVYGTVYGNSRGNEPASRGNKGKGPRNYRRPDERIIDDIIERLTSSGVDASEVEIEITNGEVRLSGSVARRWERHEIEDVAEGTRGVEQVVNSIRIKVR